MSTFGPGGAPAPVITPDLFFELLNEVLMSFGREPLDAASAHKKVIQVQPTDRVLQILAGPGSGKTEVIVWRVLYELFVNLTSPARLLVTTFTNRAATELEIRVVERSDEFVRVATQRGLKIHDPQVHNLRIGTIHSLCDALLAEYDTTYVEAGTQVIDEAETAVRIARSYRYKLGFSTPPKIPRVLNRLEGCEPLIALFKPPWEEQWPVRMMERVDFIMALLGQQTETWFPRCSASNSPNGIEIVHSVPNLTDDLNKLQTRWEAYLDENQILDFATIQKRFLQQQPKLGDIFDHVFVDEFQDSNPIQFALHTHWLQHPKTRLTVVGDDDQAIYRFRGSDIECFRDLEPHCSTKAIPYRQGTLATNYRSTKSIVSFSEAFKRKSILAQLSMPKSIKEGPKAAEGRPVRLLTGPWNELCATVAEEADALGAGRPQSGNDVVPSVALLAFSTSERQYRGRPAPALDLHRAISARGMRIYNPRNKTAGNNESPVAMLLGLISYLIDPVSLAPVGKGGRMVEVWASINDWNKAGHRDHARTIPPSHGINDRHADLQKAFVKADGGKIGSPSPSRADILRFVDDIRDKFARLKPNEKGRMTLSGFVARLLSFPLFRHSGFTLELFRQALFTQLLEANIAPTRLTMDPLDRPLEVSLSNGKFAWPNRYWDLLSIFGGYLENTNLDDPEVEAFEEDAILMITFHQAKGLEFDHIYVSATGRNPDIGPALRTGLFSGRPVPYSATAELQTNDIQTLSLALADREREIYVALTRGKQSVTILHDPGLEATLSNYRLNENIEQLFALVKPKRHPLNPAVEVREFTNA